jgi:hypothetical protein
VLGLLLVRVPCLQTEGGLGEGVEQASEVLWSEEICHVLSPDTPFSGRRSIALGTST